MIMKNEVMFLKNNKSNFIQRLNKFLEFEDPYDDLEDDCEYEPLYKRNLKSSVKDKLFTDEKLTFEEFTTLLEIVTDKFKDCFSSRFGKYDIIFRERTYDDYLKSNINIEKKESEEKNNEER